MNTNYSLVRQAYEEARERRHLANNYPASDTEKVQAETQFELSRRAYRVLVEAI